MARKDLLGSTNYTRGWDNRFGASIHLGFVSEIVVDEERADVRVIMPDKVDSKDTPLNTKPIPVLQVASQAKRQFAVPRLGTPVAIVKMANGTSSYFVLGSFYNKKHPPPVTDPNLDYVIYDDGSIMQFDAGNGQLDWKLKGDVIWDNEKGANLKLKEAVTIESTDAGITIKAAAGTILLDAQTVHLKGNLTFEGNINHTGDMITSGVHQDSLGYHTGAAIKGEQDLLARVAALERRVAELEGAKP